MPDWYNQPVQNYMGNQVAPLVGQTNTSVVAPINSLMKSAYGSAGQLGGGTGYDFANATLGTATDKLMQPINMPTQSAKLPAAPTLTNVASVGAPTAQQASVAGLGPAAQIGDVSGLFGDPAASFGGASASGFLSQYMNSPELQNYINATLAEYDDQAGRAQADYVAKGALNKALGGSRFGIGEAQLASDLTRKRALTSAELRDQAYARALQAAQGDASNATSAGIASMNAQNERSNLLGQLGYNAAAFNAGARNDQAMSLFDALNNASQFNAGQVNDLAGLVFGEQNQNARQNAATANDLASQVYGTQADLSQFNAGQLNEGLQFGITANQQQARDMIDAANARANIATAQAGDNRANLGLQMDVGTAMQDAQTQQLLEPYIQAQLAQGLLDPNIAALFTGQTINTNGTSTSKQSGGLLGDIIGGMFGLGAAAIGGKK